VRPHAAALAALQRALSSLGRVLENGVRSRSSAAQVSQPMRVRNLLFVSLAALGVVTLPATTAHALLDKVSINFGPTVTGPDDGTLIVTADPGDMLRITWALGTDTDILRYDGVISGVDTTEISRFVGSALELTGQGFDPCCNPNAPFPGEFGYFVSSDGAPIGHALNDGELWLLEYTVTNPVTDAATDMTYTFAPGACRTFFGGVCPGTSSTDAVSASLSPDPTFEERAEGGGGGWATANGSPFLFSRSGAGSHFCGVEEPVVLRAGCA